MYYLLILIILFLYNSLSHQPQGISERKEKICTFIICVILVLMAALRSDEVGADTSGYRDNYESLYQFPTFQLLVDRYTIFYMGYFGLSKLFHMAGMSAQMWFGFVEAFYLYVLMKLVNQFSKDKIFSLLVFTTVGLFSFSMAGLKQTFAMSLMMLAFIYFLDKKYWLSVLLVFATYYTHQSAFIFLGVFPLYYVRKTRWFIPLTILLCLLIYFNSYLFMEKMVKALDNEKWESYLVTDSGYTYVTFVFYTVITFIAFWNFKNYNIADPEFAKLFLGLSTLGCGLQLLAGVSPSLFRLSFLYTPFMMILLPNASYYANNSKQVRLILMGCIIFYFLYTNRHWPYSFV